MIFFYPEKQQNVAKKKKKNRRIEEMNKEYIDSLEDSLSELNDQFFNLKNSFEKIMILSKINELVFWLEMYKEKTSQNDL